MQFQVTNIQFDFGDSFEPTITKEEMDEVVNETLSTIWEAADEEDLVDEISSVLVGVLILLIIVTFLSDADDFL